MKKPTSQKILISIAIIVAAAVISFGALFAINQLMGSGQESSDNSSADESILDFSKDYGACNLLDFQFVKSTLGDAAANLQEPKNTGIANVVEITEEQPDEETDSQVCVLAFEPGGNVENGFNASNGLSIKKTVYSSDEAKSVFLNQIKSDPTATEVQGVSDAAYYVAADKSNSPNAANTFLLEVFSANESITFTIRQPADSSTFTADSALLALEVLAKEAVRNAD